MRRPSVATASTDWTNHQRRGPRGANVVMHKENINTRDEPTPASELFPLVYDELRNLAAAKFVHGSSRQTLQATALVHEAYLRMASKKIPSFQNSRHFFAAAAETMRRVVIDRAREKQTQKRGGD